MLKILVIDRVNLPDFGENFFMDCLKKENMDLGKGCPVSGRTVNTL